MYVDYIRTAVAALEPSALTTVLHRLLKYTFIIIHICILYTQICVCVRDIPNCRMKIYYQDSLDATFNVTF